MKARRPPILIDRGGELGSTCHGHHAAAFDQVLTVHRRGPGDLVNLEIHGVGQDAQDKRAARVGSEDELAVLDTLSSVLVIQVAFLQVDGGEIHLTLRRHHTKTEA